MRKMTGKKSLINTQNNFGSSPGVSLSSFVHTEIVILYVLTHAFSSCTTRWHQPLTVQVKAVTSLGWPLTEYLHKETICMIIILLPRFLHRNRHTKKLCQCKASFCLPCQTKLNMNLRDVNKCWHLLPESGFWTGATLSSQRKPDLPVWHLHNTHTLHYWQSLYRILLL